MLASDEAAYPSAFTAKIKESNDIPPWNQSSHGAFFFSFGAGQTLSEISAPWATL
jgi:hypothetical protein